jgi:enoyl-CoA hydratase/carnithine racemase
MAGLDLPLQLATRHTYANVWAVGRSEDLREGPRAFAEKRKPVWRGR